MVERSGEARHSSHSMSHHGQIKTCTTGSICFCFVGNTCLDCGILLILLNQMFDVQRFGQCYAARTGEEETVEEGRSKFVMLLLSVCCTYVKCGVAFVLSILNSATGMPRREASGA